LLSLDVISATPGCGESSMMSDLTMMSSSSSSSSNDAVGIDAAVFALSPFQLGFDGGFVASNDDPFGMQDGDFYRDPIDVTRGCTISLDNQFGSPFFTDPFDSSNCSAFKCEVGDGCSDRPVAEPKFFETGRPAELPYGGLASTTVLLEHVASPAEAMAALHMFLGTELKASITKLRLEKCSITATCFAQADHVLAHCSLKVRLFRPADTKQLVVEFRRRGGDAFVFSRIFGRAEAYLKSSGAAAVEKTGWEAVSLPALQSDEVQTDNLQPLVDMLANASAPENQAEALVGMALVASSAVKAAAVCVAINHMQGVVFAQLLSSPVPDLAQSAAYLASRLQMPPHASADTTSLIQHNKSAVSLLGMSCFDVVAV
jgi:hypothetical protein